MTTTTERLLQRRDALPDAAPARTALRNQAIELNLALAGRLARRYQGRGVPSEDLRQVAALALIAAVDRFDSARPTAFAAFAVPTILGALKRHFRDTAWDMRVPRAAQELAASVTQAVGDLSQSLGRTPGSADIAAHLHVDVADVVAGSGTYRAFRVATLDAPPKGAPDDLTLNDLVGSIDKRFAQVEDELELRPLIAALPVREKRILELYYYDSMTQAAVAGQVGVSQMHVSRLLRQSIGRLRAGLATADG